MTSMKITALAPWFGGNRTKAEAVGRELGPLGWCLVLFAGGMPEIPHIRTQAGVAVDRHRHIINLARVVAEDRLMLRMVRHIDRILFHPDELAAAQARCKDRECAAATGLFGSAATESVEPDVQWAADYFVCCWMGRGGYAGRGGELSQSISVRYTSSGGSSAMRWRSAVESLPAWQRALARWHFITDDAFAVLSRLRPQTKAGIYADPPWVGAGDEYTHRFTIEQHRRLAAEMDRMVRMGYRVVLRYGDDPLIRGLYPPDRWRWIETVTRDQRNGDVAEVLIVSDSPIEEPTP